MVRQTEEQADIGKNYASMKQWLESESEVFAFKLKGLQELKMIPKFSPTVVRIFVFCF